MPFDAALPALGVQPGLAVITKVDTVSPERVAEVETAVATLLASTSLAGSPVVPASGASGEGLDAVRAALGALVFVVHARTAGDDRPPTLAIDRAFSVRGRGVVVTGTLRGGRVARGDRLRLVPGDRGQLGTLLRSLLLEKNVYELAYDLNHRPGWTPLPLRGLREQLGLLADPGA